MDEINALEGCIPPSQWLAIDAARSIGNIAAHMEKDVNLIIDIEPYEAKVLLNLIELLMEKWYIAREDEKKLFSAIKQIADDKKSIKASRGFQAGS